MATRGARSRLASATPVARFVASGETAIGVGHESGALLVARRDKGDLRAQERIQDVQDLLPGQAEDVAHPLVLEALDDEIGSFHGHLGVSPIPTELMPFDFTIPPRTRLLPFCSSRRRWIPVEARSTT